MDLYCSDHEAYKQYPDAGMQENTMFVELVRAIMINPALTKGFKISLRFFKE